jgi:hypothetical protein
MLLKLVFSRTVENTFRVHVVEATGGTGGRGMLMDFPDEGVFLDKLLEADIDAAHHARIFGAIAIAAISPGLPSCYESVELSPGQWSTVFGEAGEFVDESPLPLLSAG